MKRNRRSRLLALAVAAAVSAVQLVTAPSASAGQSDTWSTVSPMSGPRTGLAAVTAADGRIFALGGSDSSGALSRVEAYRPSADTWTPMASMSVARGGAAAAVGNDGRIYVMGGSSGASGALSSVERYDPTDNTWTTVAPMSTVRYGAAAAADTDGRIYVIGGASSAGGASIRSSVERYDPTDNTWTTVAPTSTGRFLAAAAAGSDGRIYVMGGWSGSGATRFTSVERYDAVADSWTTVAPMSLGRSQFSAALGGDGRVYAIGGLRVGSTGAVESTSAVESYDAASDSWRSAASMAAPRESFGAAAGRDGRIYAVGGTDGVSRLSTMEVYQPALFDSDTQETTANVVQPDPGQEPDPGSLSISVTNDRADFGTLTAGGSAVTAPVGDIVYENTLDNGADWSATVAATSLTRASSVIPFAGMSFTPGTGIHDADGTQTELITAGEAGTFSGTDATPGTTFSNARTVATASSRAQGTFTHAESQVGLSAPSTSSSGTHTGTLQYTITG